MFLIKEKGHNKCQNLFVSCWLKKAPWLVENLELISFLTIGICLFPECVASDKLFQVRFDAEWFW